MKKLTILLLLFCSFLLMGCITYKFETITKEENKIIESETEKNIIIEKNETKTNVIEVAGTPNDISESPIIETNSIEIEEKYYNVSFYDGEKLLKTESIKEGESAVAPEMINKPFYYFRGWDKDFNDVQCDINVYSVYEYGVIEDTTGLEEKALKQFDAYDVKTLKIIDENNTIIFPSKKSNIESLLDNKNIEHGEVYSYKNYCLYENLIDDIYIIYDYNAGNSNNFGYVCYLTAVGDRVSAGSLIFTSYSKDIFLDLPWPIIETKDPILYRKNLEDIGLSQSEYDTMIEVVKTYNNNNQTGYDIDGSAHKYYGYSYAFDYEDSPKFIGCIEASSFLGYVDDFILLELNLEHFMSDARFLYERFENILIQESADKRLLYKDGQCYSLTEAYNLELINYDSILNMPYELIFIK